MFFSADLSNSRNPRYYKGTLLKENNIADEEVLPTYISGKRRSKLNDDMVQSLAFVFGRNCRVI